MSLLGLVLVVAGSVGTVAGVRGASRRRRPASIGAALGAALALACALVGGVLCCVPGFLG